MHPPKHETRALGRTLLLGAAVWLAGSAGLVALAVSMDGSWPSYLFGPLCLAALFAVLPYPDRPGPRRVFASSEDEQ
ncbi:hypothetical protein [Actinorugispora endophytica]|uniref:Uncharacterized protein n=1 Tax=Actinorugispora endophytica TaxID=1605990 RepID=A0A4R6V2S4_9ACTN|nr:hypothetical protein [Actinorugispora endophytica]TDQ52980.1 hypothetical protein EV190_10597 [Actinorugispora endophytica]